MCNTQNSLLLNQHNGDDAPQAKNDARRTVKTAQRILAIINSIVYSVAQNAERLSIK